MRKLHTLRMLLVLVLLGWVGTIWAENWTGNKAGRTFTQNTVLDVTGTVTVTGTQVISGCTVTINASNANRTILRGARDIALFDVRSGGTLIINGGTNKITIDGNGYNNTNTNTPTTGAYAYYGYSAILVREGGNARLTDVTMSNHKWTGTGYSVERRPEATHGGAIFVRGNLTCNNCFFSGCSAVQGGAVCVFSGGNATLTGGEVHNCQSTNRGGGVCVINTTNNGGTGHNTPSGSHATLTLSGVKIYNNTSPNGFGGGGYSEFVGANLIVKDNTEIYNNTSKSGGFGVTVADMGDIELRECDIYGNHSTDNSDWGGGGLYIGGTVDNDATAYVYEGCKIHDNVARTGGGIYLAANMHLIIEGGEIYNNTTNGYAYNGTGVGGGVYMGGGQRSRASTFEMRGGKIYNNTATERAGGGVYISQGTVTITGGEIYENNAGDDGGGIYLNAGTVNMSGGAVFGNKANNSANNGGGLYLAGGDFAMSGGEMYENQADNGAGAYLAAGSFEMSGGKMYSNAAATNGGGIYLNNGTPTVSGTAKIYTNTAVNGGGLYLNRGTFNMQGGEVYGNTATTYGGGAYLTANCTFTMTGGSLGKVGEAKNSAPTGGGLYDLGSFSMTNGNIVNNEATTNNGGGAYIQTTVATPLNGGIVAGNTAAVNGGGLYITGIQQTEGSPAIITTVTVTGTSFYGNVAGNHGGGLYLTNSSRFTLNGGSIGVDGQAKNSAKRGGGVNDLGSFTMLSGTITNNEATNGEGGGAYVSTSFATDLSNGAIRNNTASSNGGGISIAGGSAVTVGGVSIYGNTSGGNGGGVFLSNSTGNSFTMTGGAIGIEGSPNIANSGGGAYIRAPFSMTGGSISYNQAVNGDGGGAYIRSTEETIISNATISENTADRTAPNNGGNGGGIYLSTGSVTVTDAIFDHNQAITSGAQGGQGGGVSASGSMTITGTSMFTRNEGRLGGAVFVSNGTFLMEGGVIGGSSANANKASRSGGGVFVTGSSTVELQGGEVSYNEANTASDGAGGGLFINSGTITVSGTNAVIKNNIAKAQGGGVYVGGGSFTMSGGTIGGTVAQGNTTGSAGYGGGVYMNGGVATMTGGAVSGNSAPNGYGGGIYMNGGSCELSGGAAVGGSGKANNARFGGGIYSSGGAITVKGGQINYNTADADGGGIYSNGPEASVLITKQGSTLSYLQYNTAVNGGGIYANRGEVEFVDGHIGYNSASTAGGGMYVNDEGTLYLKGNAILNRNHVPTGMKGGGVYLRGTVVVGQTSKAQSSITADENFAHTLTGSETASTYTPDNDTRNNIYLPEPEAHVYSETNHRDVITVIEGGISTDSHIGFSVLHNHVPVIFCTRSTDNWDYLDRFTTGAGHDLNTVLFDDSQRYKSVHYTTWPQEFDPDHVYLYGFWPEAVSSLADVPDNGFVEDGNTVTISNKEGLAWLISYVNGLNGSDPHNSSDLVVNLEADVEMGDYGWVPIGFMGVSGSTPAPFSGTFNGNGHTISDISGLVYGQGIEGVLAYGMFGYVDGADINNVFVQNLEYHIDNNPNLVMGTLVGEVAGATNINNSETQGTLVAQNPNAILGGLIGRIGNTGTGAPTIHSTMAISNLTGGTMGGLIGSVVKGDMLNSFANTLFDYTGDSQYVGGLVAINRGNVENCYSRLRGTAPTSNFGSLVGDNAGGKVQFCYAPDGMTTYQVVAGTLTGQGTYGETHLPYFYKHRDTQLTATNAYVPSGTDVDKQMMLALNKWVEQKSTSDMAYTKWGRPWQVSDDKKPLNDDYPILRMPEYEACAAKVGDPYIYYGLVDDLMSDHTAATEAIWMYKSSESVTGDNSTSDALLYIAEDVALLNENEITAYVGITLDNSAGLGAADPTYGEQLEIGGDATDWHMVSSSLSNAPIGINYTTGDAYEFSYGHPSGMPYYRFYPKGDAKCGYFPGMTYDWALANVQSDGTYYYNPDDSAPADNGNYYQEWDFYSYDEANYHWINFKRNTASHHHFDTPAHETIVYNNESTWTPGKGYFAATREETFLQCLGGLNADEVNYDLTRTEGVPRHGYNLLGNPYQAYLDFDLFAEANSEDADAIWNALAHASYTILDEDHSETVSGDSVTFYHTYLYGSSDNEGVGAGRFLHPHQGFFVMVDAPATAATAYFYPDQRNASDTVSAKFRGAEHINYPLVNLFAVEESGLADVVTVELGRPTEGGAKLMKGLRLGNGKMWCHYNDNDYTIAYTLPGISEVNIRFETVEDTEYTMRWNTRNGDFSYLHLIDNMTGADIDCLSASEYRFYARKADYKSRFKLVFGYTGIEEPEEVEANQNFAFVMGDELVVTGEGVLQVFDVNGRLVANQELHGVQTTMALPNVSNGVYVMRLTDGKQSRVQKMVISK